MEIPWANGSKHDSKGIKTKKVEYLFKEGKNYRRVKYHIKFCPSRSGFVINALSTIPNLAPSGVDS